MRSLLSIASRFMVPAFAAMGLAAGPSAWAGTYEVLHNFDGGHGAHPLGGLAIDPSGTVIYGTASTQYNSTAGLLFRLSSKSGSYRYRVLHLFAGRPSDGLFPSASLMVDSQRRIVGTTEFGGANDDGSVFRYDPATNGYKMIFSFGRKRTGSYSRAGLTEAADGSLLGTCAYGGANDAGTLFRLYPDTGAFTTLHTFGLPSGTNPESEVLQIGSNLYGVSLGGVIDGGSPFVLGVDGQNFTETSSTDGARLFSGGLTPDGAGNLWGVSRFGGAYDSGTIYRVDASGRIQVVYSFNGDAAAGYSPQAKLLLGSDGMLYGTTRDSGKYPESGKGTIFRFDPVTLTYMQLYAFPGEFDGSHPSGSLVQDAAGALYGVTYDGGRSGGRSGYGVVYRFTP